MRTLTISLIFLFAVLSCISCISSNNFSLSSDEKMSQKIIGKWQGTSDSFDNYIRVTFRDNGTGTFTENKYPTRELTMKVEFLWRVENKHLHIEITKDISRTQGNDTLKVGTSIQAPISVLSDKRLAISYGDPSIPDTAFFSCTRETKLTTYEQTEAKCNEYKSMHWAKNGLLKELDRISKLKRQAEFALQKNLFNSGASEEKMERIFNQLDTFTYLE